MKKATSKIIKPVSKTRTVGKATNKNPTVTVFGVEFEQGNDGATFGKCRFTFEGARNCGAWGDQRDTETAQRFIKQGPYYITWSKTYPTDTFLTTRCYTEPQFNQYFELVDFDTPDGLGID